MSQEAVIQQLQEMQAQQPQAQSRPEVVPVHDDTKRVIRENGESTFLALPIQDNDGNVMNFKIANAQYLNMGAHSIALFQDINGEEVCDIVPTEVLFNSKDECVNDLVEAIDGQIEGVKDSVERAQKAITQNEEQLNLYNELKDTVKSL